MTLQSMFKQKLEILLLLPPLMTKQDTTNREQSKLDDKAAYNSQGAGRSLNLPLLLLLLLLMKGQDVAN